MLQRQMLRKSRYAVLCRCRSRHHLLQAEVSHGAQLSSVFFHHGPQLITLKRAESKILYEVLIHEFSMLRHILQQSANRIPMMTGNPLDTPDTVLLHQMFTYGDNLIFRQSFPVEWCSLGFHEIGPAVFTVIPLMTGTIHTAFDDILSPLLTVVTASGVLTHNPDFTSWTCHYTITTR